MEGAETPTCLRGASLQTGVLKAQKKRQRVCQRVEFFYFFYFSSSPVDGCCCGCLFFLSLCTALPGCTSPVLPRPGVFMLMDCFSVSLSFIPSLHLLFFSILFSLIFSFCVLPVSSQFCYLIRPCVRKHSSFCLPVVYRALVSIKWASLLLQKDSLKCQRDRGGRLFLSPYSSLQREGQQ